MRRNFYELAAPGHAPIAGEALKHIAEFYAIEKDIRGRSQGATSRSTTEKPAARRRIPKMATNEIRFDQPKCKLADAIRYALSRWEGLTRFIEDGRIELDNNTVERSIRPITLNRKNALFAGSDGGAQHWAVIASLIETCKLNHIDPLAYITDVLTRIVNSHPNRQLDSLLPWTYGNG